MNALSAWVSQVRRMPDGRMVRVRPSLLGHQLGFDWASDYPIDKQGKAKDDSCARITLEFGLDEDEFSEFSQRIKSNLNGTLPILLSFGKSHFDLSVQKPGRGHATLNRKSTKIASFVSDRIGFHYIPAIRTSSSAAEVIGRLVEKELRSIASGLIALDHLGGASSLSQKASFYKSSACDIQAFIDNDAAGKLAVEKAVLARTLKIADVNLSFYPGKDESELEDLYDKKVYRDGFFSEFGVDVTKKPIGKKSGKWSDLLSKLFLESGKTWTNSQKDACKIWLADFAANHADTIILEKTSGALDAFVVTVEDKIGMM